TSPEKSLEFSNAASLLFPLVGEVRRSQTAYAKLELLGSAVIEFLSLRTFWLSSRISVVGLPQDAPPFVERMTSIAFGWLLKPPGSWVTDKVIRYAVPFGEIATHGSEARS